MRADEPARREPGRRRRWGLGGGRLPRDDRRAIREFAETRTGVEAYLEPRTLASSLSVVLVASDGEWIRRPLPDDRWLRRFAARRGIPVYDAGRVGYPRRMRDYRAGDR